MGDKDESSLSGLQDAPTHVKLAVDLIMLLEQHQLEPNTVLQALEIVTQDFKTKARSE